jgi:hypothetical protein
VRWLVALATLIYLSTRAPEPLARRFSSAAEGSETVTLSYGLVVRCYKRLRGEEIGFRSDLSLDVAT